MQKFMWLSATALAVSVLVGSPRLVAGGEPTQVLVAGPHAGEWEPGGSVVLEIGRRSWRGIGGIVSVATNEPLTVTMRWIPDCSVILRFVAQPGGDYVIRFAEDATAEWYRAPHGLDAGPAMGPSQPSPCAGLPDSSTVPERSPAGGSMETVLLLAAALVAAP